jgi:polysaccharide export outer membrane protein
MTFSEASMLTRSTRFYLGSMMLLSVGCVSVPPPDEFNALQRTLMAMAYARKDYVLQPGDTVRLSVYTSGEIAPEYTGDVTIQPDGKITLVRLEQPIDTEDLSVSELQAKIQEAYYPLFASGGAGISDFRASVQFIQSAKTEWLPDQVYVGGEVRRGQALPYRKGMTVLQAVSMVGGWLVTANESRVVLLRNYDGKTVTREFDALAVCRHEADDIELFPGDIIYFPMSGIAIVDTWVDQYIRQLLPVNPSGIVRAASVN